MARAAVRRLAVALAAAGLLTGPNARAGGPQLREFSVAAIGTEPVVPDVSVAAPAEGEIPDNPTPADG